MTNKDNKAYEEIKTPHSTFYQEAVPLPFYGRNFLFKETFGCHCGSKFKKEANYEHHYRKEHINE